MIRDTTSWIRDAGIPGRPGIVLTLAAVVPVPGTLVLIRDAPAPPGRGHGGLAGRLPRAPRGYRLLTGDERRHCRHRVSVCHPAARCLEA